MVLLQRAVHHFEQRRENQNRPRAALLHERRFARKAILVPLGGLLGQGRREEPSRRGIRNRSVAAHAADELRDIPRHPPQMGETEITLCGGVPFNHGEPLQTFLRIENRRRSFTAALREPEFLEISN